MNLRSFYELLLPSGGQYALFHVPTRRHIWCATLDELVFKTETIGTASHSWYYAVGSFDAQERSQAHALAKRALYLDIDAGPEKYAKEPTKAYETQQAALAAIVAFARDTGLVPSLVVSSGAGVHVYFALDADAPAAEWQRVAEQLKSATKLAGLRADPTCTADSARVLRPLGALHKNGSTVRLLKATGKVWSLAELSAILEPLVPAAPAPRQYERVAADINDEVLGSYEGPPVSAVKIAEGCPALAQVAESRGNVIEPLWRAMLGLVKHTIEGADIAHQWSDGHPDYDYDQTQEKFDRYQAGPTTCAKFSEYSDACVGCQHNGKIKSPIVLGRMTVKEVAKLPEPLPVTPPPAPPEDSGIPAVFGDEYRAVCINGRYVLQWKKPVVKKDEKTDEEMAAWHWTTMSDKVFWLDEWTEPGEAGNDISTSRLVVRYGNGDTRRYDFDPGVCVDIKALLQELQRRAVTPASFDNPTKNAMQSYVNEQLRRIRANASRPVLRDRFGFQFDKAGRFMCAQGEYAILGDGSIRAALLGPKLQNHRGIMTIECLPHSDVGHWPATVWKDHVTPAARRQVEFYRRWFGHDNAKLSQLVLTLHLGSPLMVFLADSMLKPGNPVPPMGANVSLYSAHGGRGKTSVIKAGAAAFSVPDVAVRTAGKDDTTLNAFSARAAAMGTGPFGMDEVTSLGPSDACALINRIANGTDKMRSGRDGALARAPASFALVGFMTTNTPQRDLLAAGQTNSDALQLRLLELNFDAQPKIDESSYHAYNESFKTEMAPNIGALGAVIHLFCVAAGPQRMGAMMSESMEEASRILGASAAERFMVRLLACLLRVQKILEGYKLAIFPLEPMVEQFKVALDAGRGYTKAVAITGVDLLRRMLADLSPHLIATNGESMASERADILENGHTFRPPVLGRQVRSGRYTYLSADAMRDWCKKHGASFSQLVTEITRDGVVVPLPSGKHLDMVHVTRGVSNIAAVRMPCYKINDAVLFGVEEGGGNVVDLRRETPPAPPARKEGT